VKIDIRYKEGALLELVPVCDDVVPDAFEVPAAVYDAWLAWQAQGVVLQTLLSALAGRRRAEAEVAARVEADRAPWAPR
jgi:hypothetical protein